MDSDHFFLEERKLEFHWQPQVSPRYFYALWERGAYVRGLWVARRAVVLSRLARRIYVYSGRYTCKVRCYAAGEMVVDLLRQRCIRIQRHLVHAFW